eukprot:TRINITY_DN79379_c0_g1_i1.p1 TRINITY_DN79379_c0_g1~~TRINITY_DN79379_c0_g1_i1.p1  ORF type:complete len:385 (+),score=58.14 TRINITY_DN79379_c0_g1_i1:80-1234(+)
MEGACESAPSTPPARNRAFRRETSTEKLVGQPSHKRTAGGYSSPLQSRIPQVPLLQVNGIQCSGPAVVAQSVSRILDRRSGDEKYWAQIRSTQDLLSRSIGTSIALNEAAESQRFVLEPILSDAMDGQEMDRLSAVTMLSILQELVSHHNAELSREEARQRVLRSPGSSEENEGDSTTAMDEDHLDATTAMASLSMASAPSSPVPFTFGTSAPSQRTVSPPSRGYKSTSAKASPHLMASPLPRGHMSTSPAASPSVSPALLPKFPFKGVFPGVPSSSASTASGEGMEDFLLPKNAEELLSTPQRPRRRSACLEASPGEVQMRTPDPVIRISNTLALSPDLSVAYKGDEDVIGTKRQRLRNLNNLAPAPKFPLPSPMIPPPVPKE